MEGNGVFNVDYEAAKDELASMNGEKEAETAAAKSKEEDEKSTDITLKDGSVLHFDFEKISTKKIVIIKDRYRRERGRNAQLIPEVDEVYMAMVAEYACGLKYEEILKLSPKDTKKIQDLISDFLS